MKRFWQQLGPRSSRSTLGNYAGQLSEGMSGQFFLKPQVCSERLRSARAGSVRVMLLLWLFPAGHPVPGKRALPSVVMLVPCLPFSALERLCCKGKHCWS